MEELIRWLRQKGITLDDEELADILWLATQIEPLQAGSKSPEPQTSEQQTVIVERSEGLPPAPDLPLYPVEPLQQRAPSQRAPRGGIPFQAPAAAALRQSLQLGRALRPLMRKVASQTAVILDEEATAVQIAEQDVSMPVFRQAPERWLELALVVEVSRSTLIWQDTIQELQRLLEQQGAFRMVRTWCLRQAADGSPHLFPKWNAVHTNQQPRSPKELTDPSGRRLILVVSDCTSPLWQQRSLYNLLKGWSFDNPVTLLQLLPERLWMQSGLRRTFPVQFNALLPGVPNAQLIETGLPVWEEIDLRQALKLPVVTLEPEPMLAWARTIAGVGNIQTAGVVIDPSLLEETPPPADERPMLSPELLVKRFWTTASSTAQQLAGLMAAVPVQLQIVYLIQETLLPESSQVHIAEVLMSGLIERSPDSTNANPSQSSQRSKATSRQYDFIEGTREILIEAASVFDVNTVLEVVSQYIARKAGLSIKSFTALLSLQTTLDNESLQEVLPFARIARAILPRLGNDFAALIEDDRAPDYELLESIAFPSLQVFDFETAVLELEEDDLLPFEFEMATVQVQRQGIRRQLKVEIQRERRQVWGYGELLSETVNLEMVSIPEGTFVMGSPGDESGRLDSEGPQHQVSVPAFYMGKYAVTQAQWQLIAELPQIERELDPDPSEFKGDAHPVEQVSWLDAVEFCARLSQLTRKHYRLPTEAEWEYACRAGTTTPFHFGETIVPDLANYDWSEPYNKINVTKAKDFRGTTPVGQFGVANAFGLYDMYGNVWEWCEDYWHDSYEGAPKDGSAWIDETQAEEASHVLRGGSWVVSPRNCRSASRLNYDAGIRFSSFGFRVVCSAPRTL
jgi:formylglycine-generating enzyme required for sulfatase activity